MGLKEEAERRKKRCCFTGHRPEKLKRPEREVKEELEKNIVAAIEAGYITFISGMARGIDIFAAEIVLKARKANPALHLICAIPYPNFEKKWPEDWQTRYRVILKAADLIKYISASYNSSCFQKRNVWMIDHSAKVIAVFNGTPGGTKNTLIYAENNNIEITVIEG